MIHSAVTQAQVPSTVPPPLLFDERAVLPLAIATGALLLFVLGFSLYTLWLRRRNMMKARKWTEREARWDGLLLDALSAKPTGDMSATALADRVRPEERLPFLDYLLQYAGRIRGPERARLEALAAPFLPELRPQLEAGNPYRRARAVQVLGALGLPGYHTEVTQALDDPAPFVGMVAARCLSVRGSPGDHRLVVSRIERFEHWSEEYLASLLAGMGPGVGPDLRALLADRTRPRRVRRVAAAALEGLHDLEAAGLAASLVEDESDPEVLAPLLRLVAALGAPAQLAVARGFLDAEHGPVRAAAFRAVGALAAAENAPGLRLGINDRSPWVAREAARALKRAGEHAQLEHLARSDHPRAQLAAQVLRESA